MKADLKIGEYGTLDGKTFRCVPNSSSRMKRCILCDLREYNICEVMQCQPDERKDHKAVIFLQTRKDRKIKISDQ